MSVKSVVIILYCLFGWGNHACAQYFSKSYTQGHPTMLFGSVQALQNDFYITGVTSTIRSPNYQKAVFGKIDGVGNVVFLNSIIDSDNNQYDIFYNALKKTSDGNFIATGYDPDSSQKVFLLKVDSTGNILLWHEYSDSGTIFFQGMDIAEIPGAGYLISVNIERHNNASTFINDVMIIRTDTIGNVLNQKDYFNGLVAWPQVIKPMFNGHYMVGAWTGPQNAADTPYLVHTWLIEIDTMGNEVRNWLDPDHNNEWPNGMEQTTDSGWIIVRQHEAYDLPYFVAFNGSILKLDKDFNKQWEIDTGGIAQDAGMYDVKILNDGSYICAGANPIDNLADTTSHIYGWLMKVSKTGQIIWQRSYLPDSTNESYNYLTSVDTLPDGGFVACGRSLSSTYGQRGWIIRTDSTGCLLDNCGGINDVPEITDDKFSASLFPNPSKNNFSIKLSLPPGADMFVNVYDITGRLMLHTPLSQQTTTIQNQLNSGMYLWQVTNNTYTLSSGKLVIEN